MLHKSLLFHLSSITELKLKTETRHPVTPNKLNLTHFCLQEFTCFHILVGEMTPRCRNMLFFSLASALHLSSYHLFIFSLKRTGAGDMRTNPKAAHKNQMSPFVK